MRITHYVLAAALTVPLGAQISIHIAQPTDAAVRDAFLLANRYAFSTSPSRPVVITFDQSLIGQAIRLTNALPLLAVDYLVIEVAGAGPNDRVILDAVATVGSLRLSSHHVQVRNLNFRDAGQNLQTIGDGVIASGSNDVLFENCTFQRNYGVGLWFDGCDGFVVRTCTFDTNRGAGLLVDNGSRASEVRDCLFRNQVAAGMTIIAGDQHLIRGSTFDGNEAGLLVGPVTRTLVFGPGNIVRASRTAGLIIGGAIAPLVHENQFLANQAPGIVVGDFTVRPRIDDNVVDGNGINAAQVQVLLRDVTAATCAGNTVRNGRGEAFLLIDCQGVQITPSGANAGNITGNQLGALTALDSTNVVVRGISISGNFQGGAPGGQLSFQDCRDCSVLATTLTGAAGQTGISLTRSQGMTIGDGTIVQDHTGTGGGVRATDSADVVVGFRPGSPGTGITSRRNGVGVQFTRCTGSRVTGDPNQSPAATLLQRDGTATGASLRLVGCVDCRVGPGVTLDAQQSAAIGIQIDTASQGIVMAGVSVRGHSFFGTIFHTCTNVTVRDCVVDGGGVAQDTGLRIDTCTNVSLCGTSILDHRREGISIESSREVRVGAGTRLIGNGGDACLAQNNSNLSPLPRVTIESVAAVGVANGSQSGFRLLSVDARLVNVTATRCAFGLQVQGQATAEVVNAILHGNNFDRANSSPAPVRLNYSIYGSTGGTGPWIGANNLVSTATNYPRFVNAAAGDVRLQSGSPAIDSGTHFTPALMPLPSVDSETAPRIRGGQVDRGGTEYDPPSGHGNSLELAGAWRRPASASVLVFGLDAGAVNAGNTAFLLVSGTGTGPGATLGSVTLPIQFDGWTSILLGLTPFTVGNLDGSGRTTRALPIPAPVVPLLPARMTFVYFVGGSNFVSNPVTMEFQL